MSGQAAVSGGAKRRPPRPWSIGVDVGSMAVKAVLLHGEEWEARVVLPTGWNPGEAGAQAVAQLLEHGAARGRKVRVVATGYGRNSMEADGRVTEITCHAAGARRLFQEAGVRTILDIGGQDSKVISLDADGNVTDFLMNDKCAAGTGRFLQNMAVMLGCTLEDFSSLPEDAAPHPISSMCTVFAETEVVGQLARGVDRAALSLGLLDAVATRAEGMLRRVGLREPVAFTGGVSRSRNLVRLLERRLGCPVQVSPDSQFAGALGAAILATRGAENAAVREQG